jgi:hypothetical protein
VDAVSPEPSERGEEGARALQTSIEECLERLPEDSRLGVQSLRIVPGTVVGEARLAIDVEVVLEGGRQREIALRSHAWIDGYFEGKGRADSCRNLLHPPDILAIARPMVIVEEIRADSVVRGVMCLLRNE